jgi:hypothetical protein
MKFKDRTVETGAAIENVEPDESTEGFSLTEVEK